MLRTLSFLLTGLILTIYASTAQAADPLELIKKSIEAHGGAENLNKACISTASGKTTIKMGAAQLSVDFTMQQQTPDRFHMEAVIGTDDENVKLTQIFNGKEGWQKVGDQPAKKYSDGQLKALQRHLQVEHAARLTPLLDEKKYRVERLFGEFKVKDKKTIAVSVKNDAGLDVTFHFDPETHLIVKKEFTTVNFFTGKEVLQEVFLSDYKRFDGVMLPTQEETLQDGELFTSATIDHVQFETELDASLFEKP